MPFFPWFIATPFYSKRFSMEVSRHAADAGKSMKAGPVNTTSISEKLLLNGPISNTSYTVLDELLAGFETTSEV